MFDLLFNPLSLAAGQEQTSLPGLFISQSPRKASRNRSGDILLILLGLDGNSPLPAPALENLLLQTAEVYYRSQHSVTAGLREAADSLNEFLLNRNLKSAREGLQAAGRLTLLSIHHDQVLLAQAGPTRSFVVSNSGVEEFSDTSIGRGLGLSRTTTLRFYQPNFEPGDLLLVSPNPPATWIPATLASINKLGSEALRRRLVAQSGPDLQAVILQVQPGRGDVRPLRKLAPQSADAVESNPIPSSAPAVSMPSQPFESLEPIAPIAREEFIPPEAVELPAEQPRVPQTPPAPAERKPPQPSSATHEPAFTPRPTRTRRSAGQAQTLNPETRRRLAKAWKGYGAFKSRIGQGLKTFAKRVLPGNGEPGGLSTSSMLFIALIIPLVVVALAMTVYFRSGRSEQHTAYLEQAQKFIQQASQQNDAALQRASWEQALYWVKQAENYGQTEESLAYRKQVQAALDSMDGISRLELQPALAGGFGTPVNITRIVTSNTDLYLLDSSQGRILRLFMTGQGYEVDSEFDCSPGEKGSVIIRPLVDLVAVPLTNSYKATVMGIDDTGNLLLCGPGVTASNQTTLTPPDNGWGKIVAIAYSQNVLYVLDSVNNAVWRYDGTDLVFPDMPRLFFDREVPVMADATDLTVYQDDLYVLHQSGQMSRCTYSNFDFSPTRCTDPAPYEDSRSGRDSNPTSFSDAQFLQLQVTQPPEASLYILDSKKGPAIYQFSLQLYLAKVMRPAVNSDFSLPEQDVTAFAITPSRLTVLAFGNQLYYATLP
ncbi:hypothetical protein LARV_03220 [Longilinea arvoryzae]|uniref:PPM-type phosphatase domain-containing protein n=1 Tax=Longilinea arvoryzae TaxID=360412 RepID=A0A0S7BNU9_9CHLR|nr:hypothetical protein [Longilinea arvoryzae]GAP15434.1 hypothetical protein LARV_03220 [Longilinea arvoryzae]